MGELLAPPDVEVAVVAILTYDGGPWVGTEYDDSRESTTGVIRVSATGGPAPVDRVVLAQTVLVECWHDDEDDAWSVARTAWARLHAAVGTTVAGLDVKGFKAGSPNNNPDVNRQRMVRYQFLATIHTRLVAL